MRKAPTFPPLDSREVRQKLQEMDLPEYLRTARHRLVEGSLPPLEILAEIDKDKEECFRTAVRVLSLWSYSQEMTISQRAALALRAGMKDFPLLTDPGVQSTVLPHVEHWIELLDAEEWGRPVLLESTWEGDLPSTLDLDERFLVERTSHSAEQGELLTSQREVHLMPQSVVELLLSEQHWTQGHLEILELDALYPLSRWEVAFGLWTPQGPVYSLAKFKAALGVPEELLDVSESPSLDFIREALLAATLV